MVYVIKQKKEYTDRYDFHNKFHVHELYVDEFVDLLKTKFKNVNLYRQYLEVASFIDRADIDESVIQYHKNREKYNPEGKYVIAIAGNCELPQMSLSIASLHVREEYLSTLDELNYCRAEAIKCRAKISENEKEMSGLHLQIDVKKNELKLANEELDRRMGELNVRQNRINEMQNQIDVIKNELKLANEELDRRMDELNHRMDVINQKSNEISQMISEYEDLSRENILNKKRKEELEVELESIKADKLYRLTELLRKRK